ncbi:MAG: flagellar hook-associated protein FlgK [Desulfobulbaceae bacterium]|nr:flagellar hook-associated protein FlgK [Desulfobulbaceae bacterium]HIJ89732.1 flagellar hook-associated protein FlgK [Deltaproteobacteria bacterium]
MAGVSHVLSVAKEALLTHQLSLQVASNNIANVDTPGYTRQSLELQAAQATPINAGMLGGGVKGVTILRNYDQFMVQRLASQQSTLGNLQAQQESMRLVETVFNEAPGMGINDLMSQFWNSWQDMADNPELSATRQSVVQSSQSIIDQLHSMTAEMSQAKFDLGVSLDTAIKDVNSLASQIAGLNVQISTAESSKGQANDLRDKRDAVLKDLSTLLDLTYFEDKNGGYSVLMADGHALVESNESWRVDWANNQLLWISQDGKGNLTSKPVGSGAELGGKIGGWLEVRGNLIEGDPGNFLGRLDAFANSLIREINQQHTQGVGMLLFDKTLTGAEVAKNVARLTTPVDATTAATTIPAGTMTINDRSVGEIVGVSAVKGLAMGKAFNAVTAINAAETGVEARLTTLVAGSAMTAIGAAPANDNETISLDINGVTVNYTIDNDGVSPDDSTAATFAARLVSQINSAIAAHNTASTTTNFVTIEAVVGDGTNGGETNSIVLKNTNPGDESNIIISNLTSSIAGLEANTGLTVGTYTADATHNTGEITLFSSSTIYVDAGSNDFTLAQLGMGGGDQLTTFYDGGTVTNPAGIATDITFNLNGTNIPVTVLAADSATTIVTKLQAAINATGEPVAVSLVNGKIHFENSTTGDNTPIVVDSFTTVAGNGAIFGFTNFTATAGGVDGDQQANDGKFTFSYENSNEGPLLSGYDYFDELDTSGSFDLWIYNKNDGTLALPQPVTISLERAYSLDDVVGIINRTVAAATNSSNWVTASNSGNSLRLTPDASHQFAFANDTSNFLQLAGLNTFFTGHDAASIGMNNVVTGDLNLIAAGAVNSQGEVYRGDNSNVLKITAIQHDEYISYTSGSQNTLDGFYNSLVGEVANSTRTINNSYEYNVLVNNQMNEMRDSVSGVSLDEEMANLIKYQHAYTAAARLITMSDEMLQTLLDSVR